MSFRVGVFDSGLGGLSVCSSIMRILPNESILYFADNAHVPYGERPLEQIHEFALEITKFLISKGANAIVMACNMSSAVALPDAQLLNPELPVIGVIEPGAKSAIKATDGNPIGVLATTGTVKSDAYPKTIGLLNPNIKVIQVACPKFVPLVESGKFDSPEAQEAAQLYVEPLLKEGCRTIILGCTHYPFLRKAIEKAAGNDVTIIDPAEETALTLKDCLTGDCAGTNVLEGEHEFFTSGSADDFVTIGEGFLGRKIDLVNRVCWGVDLGKALKCALV